MKPVLPREVLEISIPVTTPESGKGLGNGRMGGGRRGMNDLETGERDQGTRLIQRGWSIIMKAKKLLLTFLFFGEGKTIKQQSL